MGGEKQGLRDAMGWGCQVHNAEGARADWRGALEGKAQACLRGKGQRGKHNNACV